MNSLIGSYVEVSTGSIVEEVPGKIIHLEANKKASPPETHKVSIPISTDSFFEKLFADEAVFPYSKAMELSGKRYIHTIIFSI